MKRLFIVLLAALAISPAFARKKKVVEASQESVIHMIERVQDYWQTHVKAEQRGFWDNAAYHTGNMEAYKLLNRADWLAYSDRFAVHNKWMGAQSNDKRNWKYAWYGEGHDFVLFGDWQICFQTYLDLNEIAPSKYKTARAIEVMSHECSMTDNKFWWWADALYMVMPVMTKMYRLTGQEMYLDKLTENFLWSDSLMFDPEENLYYRDGKYIFPKVKTTSGGKSFWARGDGWVLAGLAKVLADMPADYKNRKIFVDRFTKLAKGVAACQRPGGYWSRSMLCEEDAPGMETSGTAFFTYGLMWGVNHGYLSREEYGEVIEKGWKYLSENALQPDGSIGFVQPIGEKPDPTKTVDAHSQAPFGTGAWLLAACERVRYVDALKEAQPATIAVTNNSAEMKNEVVEIAAEEIYKLMNIEGGRQFVILDKSEMEQPYQLTRDGKVLLSVAVRPWQTVELSVKRGEPGFHKTAVFGKHWPNREDDLAWETDRAAWRAYGPKIAQKRQTLYGMDVFVKNTPEPMLETFYGNELHMYGLQAPLWKAALNDAAVALQKVWSYHYNHGQGMDDYAVGPTLGAGAPALKNGDQWLLPCPWSQCRIVENGPIRFVAETTHIYGADSAIVEHRTLTAEKGSHLTRIDVRYEGKDVPAEIVSGVVVHKSAPDNYRTGNAWIAYGDATDHPDTQNGEVYVGTVYPKAPAAVEYKADKGHVFATDAYKAGDTYSYYMGSAWSQYDVPNLSAWVETLQREAMPRSFSVVVVGIRP